MNGLSVANYRPVAVRMKPVSVATSLLPLSDKEDLPLEAESECLFNLFFH